MLAAFDIVIRLKRSVEPTMLRDAAVEAMRLVDEAVQAAPRAPA